MTAVRVDLVGIKNSLKTMFDDANTTTASPIDLSSSLATRVQKVLTVNPAMIPVQASYYPYVTSYIDTKSIVSDDIAVNQLNAKRRAKVDVFIVGAVWNNTFSTETKDPADDDINYLMENIELILRTNENITNKVIWQRPSDVSYLVSTLDEQTHLRAGLIKLAATVYY